MNKFVRGYEQDAGVDIILDEQIIIRPGFQQITMPCQYTPGEGEVAFLVSRGSTANKGIFPIMVAIDTGYEGLITAWVINAGVETVVIDAGDRAFGIVNLKLGKDRVEFQVARPDEKRGSKKLASSGGNNL